MELKPLNEKIGKIVDEFLDDPEYYIKFVDIAQAVGVASDNADVIKMSMFQVVNDELTFAHKELEELFFEWQLLKQLKDQEPYKTILEINPQKKGVVIEIAHSILRGEPLKAKALDKLFEEEEGDKE